MNPKHKKHKENELHKWFKTTDKEKNLNREKKIYNVPWTKDVKDSWLLTGNNARHVSNTLKY